MKIATAAYPLSTLDNWAHYEEKIARWVSDAAGQGAELLVFPEYAAMELATLDGFDVADDLEKSLFSVSEKMDEANALHERLASEAGVHILGGSAPIFDGGTRPVNRAYFFTPDGKVDFQDKQIMTQFERDPWNVVSGGSLKIFETTLGKIGVLICYDSEFPLLGRALSDCDVILSPSCTEALSGYWRVRLGSMARALENQCVTAMASLCGTTGWSEAVGVTTGMGGIFAPPDVGFPQTGVIAEGRMNTPGWTYGEADLDAIANVRADGRVLNRHHWGEQEPRHQEVTYSPLT
ncbi:Predicted amidohydrolase [Shimia gijangensis]|uniref:Predicted amidohydrolase n=1 Tax=Shimia gijangensis TaxID=1470563 RepID=A0A1M6JFQ2_9RHOB|nr:carbon-nitrogen hydrolase family protein [Shimia gijangensis]SHJ45523.1 Predicted amidohydrolase [Shimia gijangensis]